MRIVNLRRNAGCLRKVGAWAQDSDVTAEQGEDGLWTYRCQDPSKDFVLFAWQGDETTDRVGYYFYLRVEPWSAFSRLENITWVVSGPDWCAGTMKLDGNKSAFMHAGSSVKLLESGIYSPQDWAKVKAMYDAGDLPTPWFSADTMPLQRG